MSLISATCQVKNEMDYEELIRRCEAISLKLEEDNMIDFAGKMKAKGEKIATHCLIGKIFHTLINGAAKGLIQPQRGLRQGCPLSPYLFLICAEAFSSLLAQAEKQHLIHGLKLSKNVTISHLLFADDSLVFTRASTEDCKWLKAIFECYTSASGQLFNFDKSSMFFSGKIPQGHIAAIKDIFQLNVVSRHEI